MLEFISYSILFIMLLRFLHLFYIYLKTNYTTKKLKCLGQFENERYLEILNELQNNKQNDIMISDKDNYITNDNYITKEDKIEMEDSLYQYVKTVTI